MTSALPAAATSPTETGGRSEICPSSRSSSNKHSILIEDALPIAGKGLRLLPCGHPTGMLPIVTGCLRESWIFSHNAGLLGGGMLGGGGCKFNMIPMG